MSKKRWSEVERYQLWLAHSMDAPIKVTANTLHKTATGVNKALSRFGIRQAGNRPGIKEGHTVNNRVTQKTLEEAIADCQLDGASTSYLDDPDDFVPSEEIRDKLAVYGVQGQPKWQVRRRVHRPKSVDSSTVMNSRVDSWAAQQPLPDQTSEEQRQRKRLSDARQWVDLTVVLDYLAGRGKHVTAYPKSYGDRNSGRDYFLEGKLISEGMLLLRANEMRQAEGLNVVNVDGITDEVQ